jgi:hypothetical protein
MRHFLPLCCAVYLLFAANTVTAQPAPNVMTFFSARDYDRYVGESRMEAIKKLEKNGWYAIDTFYEMFSHAGKRTMQTSKTYLAPFLDENGVVVHLVPEVAPQFPGGKNALAQFKRDVLGFNTPGATEEVQKSIYIRCTISSDGSVTDVAEAQRHEDDIPREVIIQCLDGVRYMPTWTPGLYRGKPVSVGVLMDFSLKE